MEKYCIVPNLSSVRETPLEDCYTPNRSQSPNIVSNLLLSERNQNRNSWLDKHANTCSLSVLALPDFFAQWIYYLICCQKYHNFFFLWKLQLKLENVIGAMWSLVIWILPRHMFGDFKILFLVSIYWIHALKIQHL